MFSKLYYWLFPNYKKSKVRQRLELLLDELSTLCKSDITEVLRLSKTKSEIGNFNHLMDIKPIAQFTSQKYRQYRAMSSSADIKIKSQPFDAVLDAIKEKVIMCDDTYSEYDKLSTQLAELGIRSYIVYKLDFYKNSAYYIIMKWHKPVAIQQEYTQIIETYASKIMKLSKYL